MEVLTPEPSLASMNHRPASAGLAQGGAGRQSTPGSPKKGAVPPPMSRSFSDGTTRRSKPHTPSRTVELARTAPLKHNPAYDRSLSDRGSMPGSAASSLDGSLLGGDQEYRRTFLTGVAGVETEDPDVADALCEAEAASQADLLLGREDCPEEVAAGEEADAAEQAAAALTPVKLHAEPGRAAGEAGDDSGSPNPMQSAESPVLEAAFNLRASIADLSLREAIMNGEDGDEDEDSGGIGEEDLRLGPHPQDEESVLRSSLTNPITSPESSMEFATPVLAKAEREAAGPGHSASSADNPLDNSSNSLRKDDLYSSASRRVADRLTDDSPVDKSGGQSSSSSAAKDDAYSSASRRIADQLSEASGPAEQPRAPDTGLAVWERPEGFDSDDEDAVEARLRDLASAETGPTASLAPSSRPSTASTRAGPEEDAAVRDADLLDEIDDLLDAQERRRNELGTYVENLGSVEDSAGERLVEVNPADFTALVESLFQHKIAQNEEEKAADLDAEKAQLKGKGKVIRDPSDGEYKLEEDMDPQLLAGLKKIGKLDQVLAKRTIQAREVSVKVHGEKIQSRMTPEEKAAALEKAEQLLKRERQRRKREAKVKKVLEEGADDVSQAERRNLAGDPNARFFRISPEEEALVERLLTESVEDGENPFALVAGLDTRPSTARSSLSEASSAAGVAPARAAEGAERAPASEGEAATADTAPAVTEEDKAAAARLAEIDAKLRDFGREHVWDDSGVMADVGEEALGAALPEDDRGLTPRSAVSTPASQAASRAPSTSAQSTRSRMTKASKAGTAVASEAGTKVSQGRGGSGGVSGGEGAEGREAREGAFLEEARAEREAAQREFELDAQIRNLRCQELPGKLSKEQMDRLLADCRRQQEALEAPPPPPPPPAAPGNGNLLADKAEAQQDEVGAAPAQQGPADITNVGGAPDRKRADPVEPTNTKDSKARTGKPRESMKPVGNAVKATVKVGGKLSEAEKRKQMALAAEMAMDTGGDVGRSGASDNFVGHARNIDRNSVARSSSSSTRSSSGKPPRPSSGRSQKGPMSTKSAAAASVK